MARIGGTAYWYMNGRQLSLRGNFTVSPSLFERTGVVGLDRPHGHIVVPVMGYMEGDVSLEPGTTVEDVDAVDGDAVVTAELANGMVVTLREAFRAGRSEINAHDGSFRVRFEGLGVQQFAA